MQNLISEIKARNAYRLQKRQLNKAEGLIGNAHTREKRRASAIDDVETLLEMFGASNNGDFASH